MSGRPLISILLLCYNHQRYVVEAVEGVLSQTYSPLEILIFDDCSSDGTPNIIEAALAQIQTRHEVRFKKSTENFGAITMMKLAVAAAAGQFVVISCGDDVMLPNMIEEMAQVWTDERVSLVTANGYYIDQHSQLLNRTFRDPRIPADDSFETLVRDGSNACCFGPAIGFERELYATFGWPPAYLGCYDIMMPFYAYLSKGARFISKPLLKYRVHSQNTSLSLAAEKAGALKKSLVEERMLIGHIAHALLMEEEVDRLENENPARYTGVAKRIKPLLTIQLSEMAKKLARVSRQSGTLAMNSRR